MKFRLIGNRLYAARGNMMIMVGWCTAVVLLAIGLGLSIQYYFSSDQRLQFTADNLATTAALNLNYSDRIGQINNLVANARELVFNSRAAYNYTVDNYPHLAGLANRFLVESRQGADMVENARQSLVTTTLTNIRTTIKTQAKTFANEAMLPWSRSTVPELVNVRLGSIKDLESNVMAPLGNDELLELDTKSAYIDSVTKLYYGNTNLRLPEDADKNFYLASLSAPVNGIIAPAKLTSSDKFLRSVDIIKDGQEQTGTRCIQLPSAVQLDMQTKVINQVIVDVTNAITADSTAETNGAYPPPQ